MWFTFRYCKVKKLHFKQQKIFETIFKQKFFFSATQVQSTDICINLGSKNKKVNTEVKYRYLNRISWSHWVSPLRIVTSHLCQGAMEEKQMNNGRNLNEYMVVVNSSECFFTFPRLWMQQRAAAQEVRETREWGRRGGTCSVQSGSQCHDWWLGAKWGQVGLNNSL